MKLIDRIEPIAGDNFFHYYAVVLNLQLLKGTLDHEDWVDFVAAVNSTYNGKTGYIHRKASSTYPNADVLEMSVDELSAIATFGPKVRAEEALRRMHKFRGFYASHTRNRTFLGAFMGLWCALKLRVEGRLSLPWQVLWAITIKLTDHGHPSSELLTFSAIEAYRNTVGFRSWLMTRVANQAIAKLNDARIELIARKFWEHNPDNVMVEEAKDVRIPEISS